MKYVLDTCILVSILRGEREVLDVIRTIPATSFCISSISVMELHVGIGLATQNIDHKKEALKRLLALYEIIDFSAEDAQKSGEVLAHLRKSGNAIGICDIQIAGGALSRNLSVVTQNLRDFERIPFLNITPLSELQ